jgi:hypothetical protein
MVKVEDDANGTATVTVTPSGGLSKNETKIFSLLLFVL